MALVHGGDLFSYRQQFPGKQVLDFSANINPLGLADRVRQALMTCADDCLHYPDPLCRELCSALAGYEHLPESWILCGNGASDLISRIAWGIRPQTALLLAPTFADYERALTPTGCSVRYYHLREENNFLVDEHILEAISGCNLVFLCNPNNPTGSIIAPDLMKRILDHCREQNATLVIDECFMDFLPPDEQCSMKPHLGGGNLLILKAFTKIFAMPGLRLGYLLCADSTLLARIEQSGPSWAVSIPAQRCGVAAIQAASCLNELAQLLPGWRKQVADGLRDLGCKVYPSSANYMLFRSEKGLAEAVRPHGLMIRDCSNYIGLEEGFYRTAVRTAEENTVLLQTLEAVLGKKK